MASELTVLELVAPRDSNAPVRSMPTVARQVLSIDGAASSAFAGKTAIISVYTTTGCYIDIAAAPSSGNKFPLPAGSWHDFSVLPGHKVRAYS